MSQEMALLPAPWFRYLECRASCWQFSSPTVPPASRTSWLALGKLRSPGALGKLRSPGAPPEKGNGKPLLTEILELENPGKVCCKPKLT